jgi:ABC-2 type transport system permease protein
MAARTLFRRAFADARVRTLSFAAFFALYGLAQGVGYTKTFPTEADRLHFAQSFGNDASLKLFYGTPYHIETIGGYVAWRVGGISTLVAAFFGLLAAVRAFRSEEESGRFELVAVGAITRRAAFVARLAAVAATLAVVWLATFVGVVAGGLPAAGAAVFALGVVSVAAVYTGVGLVAGQLMPSGAGALQLGGAVFGIDFLLRVVADIGNHPTVHWLAPLGWAEEVRAFTDPRPVVLLLPLAVTVALCLGAFALERRRDIGAALFASHDTVPRPRLWLLSSATQLAMRLQALGLGVWLLVTALFAVVLGTLTQSVVAGLTDDLRQQFDRLGLGKLATVQGILGFYFLLFILEIALFCCSQIGTARGEESAGRLETLFALPQDRVRWLSGRLGLAVAGAVLLAVAAGLGAAIGATAAGASVSFPKLLAGGLNCLPASLLFLGIGALLIAVAPRQGVGLAYGLVAIAFVWYIVGALLKAPGWLRGVSPFDQVGFVPATEFRGGPAAVMLAIGAIAAALALVRFRNRDLVGS